MHRQTGLDTPALPPDRPAPTDARYHRRGDPWPLYASLEAPTVWAELAAATRGSIDPSQERRRLWRLDVTDLEVVDLRRPEVRDELGVALRDLTGPRSRAQSLTARAVRLGAGGMIVPSAALDGAWNLVVFASAFGSVRVAGSSALNPRTGGGS